MTVKNNLLIAAALFVTSSAMAGDLSLGAGAVFNESPYKGYNENTTAVPLVSYEGDRFYVRQTTGGWILWKDSKNEISLTASWMPLSFDPDDNDDRQMKHLDERKASAFLGGAYYRHESWGSLKFAVSGDAMDESGGVVGEISYFHPIRMDRLTLIPSLGVFYSDESYNDYYYGVSKAESRRSGLKSYSADDGWDPYLELTASYNFLGDWNVYGTGRYSRLSDEIKDSPMVDKSWSGLFSVGVTYKF